MTIPCCGHQRQQWWRIGIHNDCNRNLTRTRHPALPPLTAVVARVGTVLGCKPDVCPKRDIGTRSKAAEEIQHRIDVIYARRPLKAEVENDVPGRLDFPHKLRECS